MGNIVSIMIGYSLGCLNPSAFISKLKKKDLREYGTNNLGAMNVMLIFGLPYGLFVMLFDVLKAFVSCKIVTLLFPQNPYVGMVAGVASMVGHNFPFYLKFKGGKGLAPFGGMVLAYNPWVFLSLFVFAIILMLIVNYSFVVPYSVGIIFPVVVAVLSRNVLLAFIAAIGSVLILWKHADNIVKAKNGTDVKIREYIGSLFRNKEN
ncbi:MAG: glycerol-3-phosphate acyltransferase [Clostridia bacterium]|nr:glycerol-3-phosphate acyltransferase [Clostridia bacterium]